MALSNTIAAAMGQESTQRSVCIIYAISAMLYLKEDAGLLIYSRDQTCGIYLQM